MIACSNCQQQIARPEDLLAIETEVTVRYFCRPCTTKAVATLSMRLFMNKEERKLLKQMKKFLKYGKSN